jgi:2-polyprenyl-6-methoxyphenol hydroxylase-like FAD-dependent oxidoreductase
MKISCKIAIIGAGISGLAAAVLLRQQGHEVSIFEKFSKPKPLGSGLLLQQTGLAVLAHLGLDQAAINAGAIITQFEGKTTTGKKVFELSHKNLDPRHYSLGIHRHSIFSLLYKKVIACNIPVITNFSGTAIKADGNKLSLVAADNRGYPDFDLIVDASGAHSAIRDKYADIKYRKPFSYGALWGVCEDTGLIPNDILQQRFQRANISIGIIPIGRKTDTGNKRYFGLHWSIRNTEAWNSTSLYAWKEKAVQLWPEVESLITQFKSHNDLTKVSYADIALKRFFAGNMVFIGDAAHSISPRLGQGANLGLVDALILSKCILKYSSIEMALSQYDLERKSHVNFYHAASKWLALLFQSDSFIAPLLRDAGFSYICKIPYMQRQMLQSLGGFKTGLFSALDLAALHEGYGF